MASPRKIQARVYLSQDERASLKRVMDEMVLTESAAIRWLMIHGLRAMEKQVSAAKDLRVKMTEPGERKHPIDDLIPSYPDGPYDILQVPREPIPVVLQGKAVVTHVTTADSNGQIIEEYDVTEDFKRAV